MPRAAPASGFTAWLMWLSVHLVYLIGFKNRLTTLLHWAVSFVGPGRSERTLTQQQVFARQGLEQLGEDFPPRLSAAPEQEPRPAAAGRGCHSVHVLAVHVVP